MQIFLILLLLPNLISALALGNELFFHLFFSETFIGLIAGTTLNEIFFFFLSFEIDHHLFILPVSYFFLLPSLHFSLDTQKYMGYNPSFPLFFQCLLYLKMYFL